MRVFISYTKKDLGYVEQLGSKLQENQVTVLPELTSQDSENAANSIEEEIRACTAVVTILSPDSIHSDKISKAVLIAKKHEKPVIPIVRGALKEIDFQSWARTQIYIDHRREEDPIPLLLEALGNLADGEEKKPRQGAGAKRSSKPGVLSEQLIEIIAVPENGRVNESRIALHPRFANGIKAGLFTSFPSDPDDVRRRRIPLSVIADDSIPVNSMVMSQTLLQELDMDGENAPEWDLNMIDYSLRQVEELHLELMVEASMEDAVRKLRESPHLTGRLIWEADQRDGEYWLEISGLPYRVTHLSPVIDSSREILQITEQTSISLYSSGSKTGMDIVILADQSGSMDWEDLSDTSDMLLANGKGNIKRIEAVRRSLNQLLETRLRVAGRVSRLALLGFTTKTHDRFPVSGKDKMAQVDGSVDETVLRNFRDAIGLLRPLQDGTDIGQALHHAAEVLHKHGHPGNERLIVLISDGAVWVPKGNDAAGEVVSGVEDTVSLMDHLHRSLKIHLHVIGISKPEIFHPWFKKNYPLHTPHESAIPNHELLEQLIKVGGGDPSRIGDTEVLEEYFSGLGGGVTRAFPTPQATAPPKWTSTENSLIQKAHNQIQDKRKHKEIRKEFNQIASDITNCVIDTNVSTDLLFNKHIFFLKGIWNLGIRMRQEADTARKCENLAKELHRVLFDRENIKWMPPSDKFEVPELAKLLRSRRAAQFGSFAHLLSKNSAGTYKGNLAQDAKGYFSGFLNWEDLDAKRTISWTLIQSAMLKEALAILNSLKVSIDKAVKTLDVEASAKKEEQNVATSGFRFIG